MSGHIIGTTNYHWMPCRDCRHADPDGALFISCPLNWQRQGSRIMCPDFVGRYGNQPDGMVEIGTISFNSNACDDCIWQGMRECGYMMEDLIIEEDYIRCPGYQDAP